MCLFESLDAGEWNGWRVGNKVVELSWRENPQGSCWKGLLGEKNRKTEWNAIMLPKAYILLTTFVSRTNKQLHHFHKLYKQISQQSSFQIIPLPTLYLPRAHSRIVYRTVVKIVNFGLLHLIHEQIECLPIDSATLHLPLTRPSKWFCAGNRAW